MCGIICALDRSGEDASVSHWVREQLQAQLTRGKEGFGLLSFEKGFQVKLERSVELTGIVVPMHTESSSALLLHHRHPTSTDNLLDQTHPIKCVSEDFEFDYYVVHNGIISNNRTTRTIHEGMGIKYTTSYLTAPGFDKFNDSECVGWEVAMLGETDKKRRKEGGLSMRTEGSCAFMAVKVDKETQEAVSVLWGRNSCNPLNLHNGGGKRFLWSSTGAGKPTRTNRLFELDLETLETHDWPLDIPENTPFSYESKKPTTGVRETRKMCTTSNCYQLTSTKSGMCFKCEDLLSEMSERTKVTKSAKQLKALPEGPKPKEDGRAGKPPKEKKQPSPDKEESDVGPFELLLETAESDLAVLLQEMEELSRGDLLIDFETEKQRFLSNLETDLDRLYEYNVQTQAIKSDLVGEA